MQRWHYTGEEIYMILKHMMEAIATGIHSTTVSGKTLTFNLLDGSSVSMEFPELEPSRKITGFEMKNDGVTLELTETNETDGTEEKWDVVIPGAGIIKIIDSTQTVGGVPEGTHYPVGYSLEQIVREILSGVDALSTYIASDKDPDLYRNIFDESTYITSVKYTYGAIRGRGGVTFLDLRKDDGTVVEHWEDIPDGDEKTYTLTLAVKFPIPTHTLEECIANPAYRKLVYHAYAEDDAGFTADSAHTIEWGPPKYWILVDGSEEEMDAKTIDTLTQEEIMDWNEIVEKPKATNLTNLTCTYGKIGIALPKELGTFTSCLDKQNFECLNTYYTRDMAIRGFDYTVYWLADAMSLNKVDQHFT